MEHVLPGRTLERGWRAFALLGLATASAVIAIGGGSASAVERSGAPGAVVDPAVVRGLAAHPEGVTAIVTAWSRRQLEDVSQIVAGRQLRVLPVVVTTSLTKPQLERLRRSTAVRSVFANTPLDLFMEDTTWITRARYAWASSSSGGPVGLGTTGKGVELAVVDTGIDGMHEDADNLIEFCDATAGDTTRTTVLCSPYRSESGNAGPAGPTNQPRTDAHDPDVSHGTHVSGTMAGTGDASGGTAFSHSTAGVAPEASLRVYSANVASSLLPTQTLAAYDDLIYKKLHGLNDVVAVNNSWGGTGGANYNPNDPIHVAVNRAFDAGIVSVFAAGNSGPEHNTLSPQCVNPRVVCVAASTKNDQVVAFSSRGRPSQPSDTNRDGTEGGPGDIAPDNHDWRLGQAFELGRYRPTLTAPGVNINSIRAIAANIGDPTAATCREIDDSLPHANCYVQANGTSMATPHVTGAIGLVVQSYRAGHNGKSPSPNQIIDILERSSNVAKLPGWDAEEQGAGRLDAYEAVKVARTYPKGSRAPNIGYPTPPYAAGEYPGAAAISQTSKGCTGTASWTARTVEIGEPGVGQPPAATTRYGQHFITVPDNTDRIRVTITWPRHATANIYGRLWRPGVDPNADSATPDRPGRTAAYHQARVFPDQEGIGLPVGLPPTMRLLEIRAPEGTQAIPAGTWVLRVFHRAGGAPALCGATQETPQVAERTAYEYDVKVELPRVTQIPSATIGSPASGTTIGSRFAKLAGTATYPAAWEGVTNWEAPGSAAGGSIIPDPDNRPVLYFHGNAEEGCTGDGRADLVSCDGPFLMPKTALSSSGAASWKTSEAENVLHGSGDRTIYDPSWSWCLAAGPGCPSDPSYVFPGPTTVQGPMTVEWWAECDGCAGSLGLSADWRIRVWADGVMKFEQRVTASPAQALVASRVEATVTLPAISANQRLTLHIDPVYVDSQAQTMQFYDSENPCQPGLTTGRCDSLVRMPVGTTGGGAQTAAPGPANLRVTDLPAAGTLRVAWDPVAGASSYEVYRSTDPAFAAGRKTRVFSGAGADCVSPQAPTLGNPPGHDRAGRCFTDGKLSLRTTYYYRVAAVMPDTTRTAASLVAYGTPTRYDRQVKVRDDRLYGPAFWENALEPPSPNPSLDDAGTQWAFLWDTAELAAGPHDASARSFTQGIGSRKATAQYVLAPTRP